MIEIVGDVGILGGESCSDLFDAGHDRGVVAVEDIADFHVGEFELFAEEVHGDLAGKGCFAGLGFSDEVFCFNAEHFGDRSEDFIGGKAVFLILLDEFYE